MTVPLQSALDICTNCSGKGVLYDSRVEVGRYGKLRICDCVQANCLCRGEYPYQYWDESSRLQWCPCGAARRRLLKIQKLFKQSDVPAKYRWKFQDDFSMQTPDGEPIPIAAEGRGYVSTLVDGDKEPRRGFVLFGSPGTGKTLLGCIMLNELILHRARAGLFLSLSRKFFQQLRDTYSAESERYGQTWQVLQELCDMPYLLLDDFRIQRGTEWEMEMLYELIDARYSEERFTIVTTNQPLEEIQQQSGGRIYSRLIEMCRFVGVSGADYRQRLHPVRSK